MKVTYDPRVDVLSIALSDAPVAHREQGMHRRFGYLAHQIAAVMRRLQIQLQGQLAERVQGRSRGPVQMQDLDLMTENRRRALAESYFELGETGKAEALYRDWLHADPRWGWGWIGWPDGYEFTRTRLQDWPRAEQILREGLAVDQVGDRPDIPCGSGKKYMKCCGA